MSKPKQKISGRIQCEYQTSEQDENINMLNRSQERETTECSTQVNLDDEFFWQRETKQKKKNKRKQYKQRKKNKKVMEQKSSKIKLADIISDIYERRQRFDNQKNQIQKCLLPLTKGDKFHAFLNHTIRIHVSNIQKGVWDYVKQIIHQTQSYKEDEDYEFYQMIVQKLYSQYESLKQSSLEIEKIINMFMQITSGEDCYDEESHQLDRNTFNYLIESEQNIKNLIRICQQRIPIDDIEHIQKLKQICEMMSPDYPQDQYIEERSTSIEEQQIEEQSKSKKKKKKNKQQDFSNKYEDVANKLLNTVIVDEQRKNCQVSNSWLSSLEARVRSQI